MGYIACIGLAALCTILIHFFGYGIGGIVFVIGMAIIIYFDSYY